MHFYDFEAMTIDGDDVKMATYENKVVLVVNVASKCGFTPQYKGLEELYERYGDKGSVILGFPCDQFANQEPGDEEAIKSFCSLNYGVSFPLFGKIKVKGPEAHPIYQYLTKEKGGLLGDDVKWNFTKFLVDRQGNVVERFAPQVDPLKIADKIERLLSQ